MECTLCSTKLIKDKILEDSICRLCGVIVGKNSIEYHCSNCSSKSFSICGFCKICPEGHYLGKIKKSRFSHSKLCFKCKNFSELWRLCLACSYEICDTCVN